MAKQKQLSLCIVTKNEEEFFPDCLKNLNGAADETLVVDLGSSGRAPELAKQAGAAVYQPKWENDFSKIKNFCMDHAAGKWVLFLQADETISREQIKEIRLLLKNPTAEGYLLELDGKFGGFAGYSPVQALRLIRKRENYRFRYRSFESIPNEELYSIHNSGIRVTRSGRNAAEWLPEERDRLLRIDLEERPLDGYVRYLRGIQLMNQEKYGESAASFELARQLFTGEFLYVPHLYRCLGRCLLALEQYREAEEILSEGFLLFPFYCDLLALRAEMYHRLGRDTEALQDLQLCLKLRNSPDIFVPEAEVDSSAILNMQERIRINERGS